MNGNSGRVVIDADGDVLTGAIASNVTAGSGKGGNIDIVRGENIIIESLQADSIYTNSVDCRNKPVGANVLIDTQGTVTLNQTAFVIGDASTNGTIGAISDGVATFDASAIADLVGWVKERNPTMRSHKLIVELLRSL